MKDSCSIVAVDVVYDSLFAHKFQPLNPKEICSLKQFHHIVQSYLAFISVQIGQDFDEHFIPDLLKSDAGSSFVGLLVQWSLLKHSCKVGASTQEKLVRRYLPFLRPINDECEV